MRRTGMTKRMSIAGIMTAALSFALFTGCGSSGAGASSAATQAATQTEAQAAAQASTQTEAQAQTELSGNVSTNGSTSMESVIGILSEQFMADHSDVTITYDATGSGSGIEAVSNGTCDIGLASRDLKEEEKGKGLLQTTIALDGIAVIVNANSAVEDLTLEQISDIYTGKITDWSQVGGEALEIACIGREAGSGTRDGFESITKTKDQCVLTQELTSTGAVIEAVKNSENAVGYVSFSAAEGQEGIRMLTVGGVACSEETIAAGSYAIQRNFNLITKQDNALSAQAQGFFDYMLSEDAHELIRKTGVVPAGK